MAGELSCPSCKKIFVAGVSGVGSCSGCGAQVRISKNPGNPMRRRNPPSDDRIVVQRESGGYGVHYLIRGDSKPDDLNRVAVVPSREAAETLAQTLHTETGAGVSKNPRGKRNPEYRAWRRKPRDDWEATDLTFNHANRREADHFSEVLADRYPEYLWQLRPEKSNPRVSKDELGIIKGRLKDVDKKLDTARHETFDAQSTLGIVQGNLAYIAQQPE